MCQVPPKATLNTYLEYGIRSAKYQVSHKVTLNT